MSYMVIYNKLDSGKYIFLYFEVFNIFFLVKYPCYDPYITDNPCLFQNSYYKK